MNKVYIIIALWDIVGDGTGYEIVKACKTKTQAQYELVKAIHAVQAEYETECLGSEQVDDNFNEDFDYWSYANDDFYYSLAIEEKEIS